MTYKRDEPREKGCHKYHVCDKKVDYKPDIGFEQTPIQKFLVQPHMKTIERCQYPKQYKELFYRKIADIDSGIFSHYATALKISPGTEL